MIVAAPSILHDQWMLVGRQVDSGNGRLDLLAVAPDGALILIELKRDRTPRDVVAQAIDYATFVAELEPEDIASIYTKFNGGDLGADFKARFGLPLDEDALNDTHQIVVVASAIDDSTERIVQYLTERDIAINVLCFQVFSNGDDQLLSRVWLVDPVQTQASAASSGEREREPWIGEVYASFGHGDERSWIEAVEYGFISAGGGTWYSNSLNILCVGDRIWVKAPRFGFVGVARVAGRPIRSKEFTLQTPQGMRPALEVLKQATYHREHADDPDRSEYFVPVQWLQTVPLEQAVQEVGMFGNQNTVCKPTTPKWRHTIDRLKIHFPSFDAAHGRSASL